MDGFTDSAGAPKPGTSQGRGHLRRRAQGRRPTTPPPTTTGFTPWSQAISIPSAPSPAPSSLPRSLPPPVTWSTCPATSFIASATMPRPKSGSPNPPPSTRPTCTTSTSPSMTTGTTPTTLCTHRQPHGGRQASTSHRAVSPQGFPDAPTANSPPPLYPWGVRDSMTRVNTQLPVALRSGDWRSVSHAPRLQPARDQARKPRLPRRSIEAVR